MEEYKILIPGWLCLRCGHKWPAQTSEPPMVCPKCRSPYFKTRRKDTAGATVDLVEVKIGEMANGLGEVTDKRIIDVTKIKLSDIPITIDPICKPDTIYVSNGTDNVKVFTPPQHIPQKDITPDNQDETQKACFVCAQERKYDCSVKDNYDIGKQSKAENDLCPDCVAQEFWTQKDMFKEIIGVSKEPEIAFTLSEDPNSKDRYTEMAYKCNLKTKYPGGKIICANKDRGRVVNEACPLCWELEEIWGVEAVGYKERRKPRE